MSRCGIFRRRRRGRHFRGRWLGRRWRWWRMMGRRRGRRRRGGRRWGRIRGGGGWGWSGWGGGGGRRAGGGRRRGGGGRGALGAVAGRGEVVGAALVRDPRVAIVAFTGSKEVGLSIVRAAAETPEGQLWVKRVVCEMGGKNAMIVDASADLDEAVLGV